MRGDAAQIYFIAGATSLLLVAIPWIVALSRPRKAPQKAGCRSGYPTEEKALELHQRPVSVLESKTHLKFKLVNGLRAANEAQWDRDVERYHALKHSAKLWTMAEAEFLIQHCHDRAKRLNRGNLRNFGL